MGRRGSPAVVVIVALLALPAAAHAGRVTAVTMYSDSGDYIGGGVQRVFAPPSGSVTASGGGGQLSVGVGGGPTGAGFSMEFAAPPGSALGTGVYVDAERAAFRSAGHPGIDISGDGRGCNEDAGRFEVKDLAWGAKGAVQRLWLVYEQHCEGGTAATFGEIRVNEPAPDAPAVTVPAIVRWPPVERGGAGTAVPVTLFAPAATQVSGVAVHGDHPGDFPIRVDECSGRSLPAGGSCQVWLRFAATAPGTRTAALEVAAGGRTYATALQGFSYGGTTKVTMHSDPGDYIGGGRDWSYTPANSTVGIGGGREHVSFGIDGGDGSWWSGDFDPPQGDIIAPGPYENATRYPFNGTGAGLDVGGNGRGCNELTGRFVVNEAVFDPGGRLKSFDATFEQHCEGASPALHGEVAYRAGDTTAPAPWMVAGAVAPPTRAARRRISLRPTRHDIVYGQATRLRGTVTRGRKRVRRAAVELQAAPFPYGAYTPVAHGKTGRRGRFAFRVRPDRNTRYRVVSGAGASKRRTVFVDVRAKFRRKAVGGRRFRETIVLTGPPDLPYAGRRIWFYRVTHHGKRARRAGHATLRALRPGRLTAGAVLRLRGRRQHTFVCLPEQTPDAWGRAYPVDRACGARVLVAARAVAADAADRSVSKLSAGWHSLTGA